LHNNSDLKGEEFKSLDKEDKRLLAISVSPQQFLMPNGLIRLKKKTKSKRPSAQISPNSVSRSAGKIMPITLNNDGVVSVVSRMSSELSIAVADVNKGFENLGAPLIKTGEVNLSKTNKKIINTNKNTRD